jgi:hypothetical protein
MSEASMSNEQQVKRYDCGNGGAQFCQGCYTMEENALGDYVRYEDFERLRAALVKSVAVVQGWHNMGLGKSASTLWDIYWRSSPEMKPIREALTALETRNGQ